MKPVTVRDYDGLIAAFRARVDEIGISYAVLEELMGLQAGDLGKLMGPSRVKMFSAMTVLEFAEAAALKITIEPDHEAATRMADRWGKRDELQRRTGIIRK